MLQAWYLWVVPNLWKQSRLLYDLLDVGNMHNHCWIPSSGWTSMPYGSYQSSFKWECEADLGIQLQSGGKIIWHGEDICSTTNYYIGRIFDKMLVSISDHALHVPLPSKPLKHKEYSPLYLLSMGPRNPYRWTTYQVSPPLNMEMTTYLWFLIDSLIWQFWLLARRVSQQKSLPNSSSTMHGYTWDYHKPSY